MRIRPGTAVLVRGPSSVQIGGDPESRIVLDDVEQADALALITMARADEGAPRRLLDARLRLALESRPDAGATPRRLRVRFDAMDRAGAIAAALIADQCASSIEIHEPRPAGPGIALETAPESVGVPIERVVARLVHSRFPTVATPERSRADLVIVSAERIIAADRVARLLAEDATHLPVVRTESGYDIGPLVLPGRSPCYGCLTAGRAIDDVFSIHAAIASSGWPLGPVDARTAHRAALVVCDAALAFASGRVEGAVGILWSVGPDDVMTRTVAVHAECGCGAAGTPFPPA